MTVAFGGRAEATLVDALRAHGPLLPSLVAEDAGEVVGHLPFSPVTLSAREGGGARGGARQRGRGPPRRADVDAV